MTVGKYFSTGVQYQQQNAPKPFHYQDVLSFTSPSLSSYRLLTEEHVSQFKVDNEEVTKVAPAALIMLTEQAMIDVAHVLRPAHLQQLRYMHVDGIKESFQLETTYQSLTFVYVHVP